MLRAGKRPRDETELSPSISTALVDSLFQNYLSVFAGSLSAAVAAVMIAWRLGNLSLWLCALFIITVGIARAIQMRIYERERRNEPLTLERAAWWEPRYKVGADLFAASLGIWCFVVLVWSDDTIAHMLCTSVTIGYTAASVGRNYGRPWIIQLHILFACAPLSVGLALRGDLYYLGLALLLVLFFIGLKYINLNLNQIFVKALVSREREAALAGQFDTALNNMPHGLCMFDADGSLAVINRRFVEMMRLPDAEVERGIYLDEIMSACVKVGTLQSTSAEMVADGVRNARATNIVTIDPGEARERALEWTFQPMPQQGTVVLVEDVTERRQAEARINHLARFDELTGLPNRVAFRDLIGEDLARRDNKRTSALLFIDLDQFKQVNDTLGHPCGDMLLCAVADRLREMLRPDDVVARFGGDEFVVFQREIQSHEDAASLARRIVNRLSERYEIEHHLVEIGASIGIALTPPHGISADHLLKNADVALYRAKSDGRGTFCFFREELATRVEARRTLELDLRHALANEEFELHFQPLVNLKSGRVTTCEALLRWNHPTRGAVSPGDIIPVAEEMGMIIDLGRWTLRKACMECMKWPGPVGVAVNLSPLQFHQRDVVQDVRYALEVSGLPPHRLEVEITESSLLRNTQWTRDALAELRKIGVRISLDDFGTGYSSLSYLHSFPLTKVKIDRSFLEGIASDKPLTLLRGIARLSADLGMSVVVEGIETSEQLELVGRDGTVTEVQGYLFSPPVTAPRIRRLLRASHGRGPVLAPEQVPLRPAALT
ncbi:EAL domain-containing protein [Bradyrhizobium sp. LHD-71]|uniref:putative bifunctional diguanylate cyclase/phosphodiesterase n=1 Tax=Bradyrhizobium sp. LHD-71 TaxID=3072141 RepID=UPI00280F3F17|nr:EAL domain-containing protein [Bradyrhizobium sp. LHD-71]MDQ8729000.1 EAL domain-containing protein [Bradyrhizobium sp. LHD-71]